MVMNTFLTPSIIAPEALVLLESNMVTGNLFYRDYEVQYTGNEKVGDTITIRNRGAGTVRQYDGTSITVDDIDENGVQLVLERHFDLSIKVSSRDLRLNLQDFASQIMAPNLLELAEEIDSYAASKFRDLPMIGQTSAGTANSPGDLPNSIASMAHFDRTLNDARVPTFPRYQVVSPEYKATLLGVDSFVEVDKSGANDALRRAQINNLMGFDTFMSQNVPTATFTSGTQTAAVVNGEIPRGSRTLVLDGAALGTGTLLMGDILTIAGYGNVVVAANVTFVGNAATVTILEEAREIIADNSVITVYDGGTNNRQNHGAIFHPRALALAVVPLSLPMSNVNSALVSDRGFAIRITQDWDRNLKSDVISMDVLVGAKVVDGRLGAQVVRNV